MHHIDAAKLRVRGAALATVAVLVGAALPASAQAARAVRLKGEVSETTVAKTICKINGGLATSTETVTTIRTYNFVGHSTSVIASNGTTSNEFDRKVEGVSDAVKDSHLGPAKGSIPMSKTAWGSAVKRRVEGKGRNRRVFLVIDVGRFTGGMKVKEKASLPGKLGHFGEISEKRPARAIGTGDERCTATEEVSITGFYSVMLTRSA